MWLREIFPKNRKMRLSSIIKDKKVTYSNSSLKLWKERYATDLIPVKSYNKGLIFLVVKTVANASAYSNNSQYSGAMKACKKFAST